MHIAQETGSRLVCNLHCGIQTPSRPVDGRGPASRQPPLNLAPNNFPSCSFVPAAPVSFRTLGFAVP